MTSHLEFDGLVTGVVQAPKEPETLYVIQQNGIIYQVINSEYKIFFDISSEIKELVKERPAKGKFPDERGLLNMAFHPEYNTEGSLYNGIFIILWSTIDNPSMYYEFLHNKVPRPDHMTCLGQFVRGRSLKETMTSGKILLCIPQPEANHNGGGMVFGPDGYLWIGLGDGGGANDEHGPLLDENDPDSYLGFSQDIGTYHGKLLRIEIDHIKKYKIPMDNPKINPDLPEIVALGFRNPWRMSFNKGRLFIGDVGQNRFEMVYMLTSMGGNYGWRGYEGYKIFNEKVANQIQRYEKLQNPIFSYGRDIGSAIIGVAYDNGKLYFADYRGIVGIADEKNNWKYDIIYNTGEMNTSLNKTIFGKIYLSSFNPKTKKATVKNIEKIISKERLTKDDIDKIFEQAISAAKKTKSLFRFENGILTYTRMHIVIMVPNDSIIKSMDDAWEGSKDIAHNKAYTAFAFSSNQNSMTTRDIGILSQPGKPLWNIGNSNKGKIIEFPGGLPLYKNGKLVGAIGVSGDGVDQDETVAILGSTGYEAPKNIRRI